MVEARRMPHVSELTTGHLGAAFCFAGAAALCLAARLRPGPWVRPAALLLGAFVLVWDAAWFVSAALHHAWTPAVGLPLQLCDAAPVLAAAALWTCRPWLVELLYFWAFAGTLQALLTPSVTPDFSAFDVLQYYAAHGGILAAALFLVVGLGITPRPGAVRRCAMLTLGYTAGVAVVDLLTGGDYLYLRRPPPVHTLFDLMGPWPWYLAAAALLGLVLFAALNAPFWWGRRVRANA
jgi:hypothetical integral membrane protein (TIGR02206 family)